MRIQVRMDFWPTDYYWTLNQKLTTIEVKYFAKSFKNHCLSKIVKLRKTALITIIPAKKWEKEIQKDIPKEFICVCCCCTKPGGGGGICEPFWLWINPFVWPERPEWNPNKLLLKRNTSVNLKKNEPACKPELCDLFICSAAIISASAFWVSWNGSKSNSASEFLGLFVCDVDTP